MVAMAAASEATMPRWQQLTAEVRQSLIAVLTQMLQQHLATANASDGREVADECR